MHIFSLVAMLACQPAPAGDTRLLVRTFTSTPTLDSTAQHVTELAVAHLGHSRGLKVISQGELDLLIEHERDRQALESCTEGDTCMPELYRVASADKVLFGRVGRWGTDGYLVTLRLINGATADLERGESATADSASDIESAVNDALDRLFEVGGAERAAYVFSHEGTDSKMAVLNLAAYDVSPELAANLTEMLAIELRHLPGTQIITPNDVRQLIAYEYDGQMLRGDADVSRLLEFGESLRVSYLVGGAVGRLHDTFVIHLKLLDVSRGGVVNRISEAFRAPESDFAPALRMAVRRLLGKVPEGQGSFRIVTNVDEATGTLNGGGLSFALPMPKAIELEAKKHALSLRSDGYVPLDREFYVEPNQLTDLVIELEPVPQSWYAKWWVWTIVGVAVAGTTTAVVIATAGSSGTVAF